ncbi:MBL fold metallo-hydrolase [Geminicoccaceae bacterium 1502E]|nr:MBL fold metallo-hydrolase [Geminicoccaceae bacterium 1502E]
MPIRLTFHGAASTVTGSCFLIEHPKGRFLVDCGLFQGTKTIRELNYGPFPFAPKSIDFVLLTHAHIDHAGLLPKLWKAGFEGPVMATEPTLELLRFMLPDSGYIQESEVRRLNARNRRRGRETVEPIYTRADAEACLERVEACDYGRWFEAAPGVRVQFWNASHILGSASLEIEIADGTGQHLRLLFSGDIGPEDKIFHDSPSGPRGLDYVIMEATYGDRDREDVTLEQRRDRLRREIADALAAGGNLVIPAFAVERSQELLYTIMDLMAHREIPSCPVFLDSPLAIRATEVFAHYRDTLHEAGDLRRLFERPELRFCVTAEESMAINRITGGAIVLAASGMCEAGRIRHHLRHNLWRPQSTVLFTGYQAPGTLGHVILSGESTIRLGGEEISVKARIRQIDGFSGHADQPELMRWLAARQPVRGGVFLVHGEDHAIDRLRQRLDASGCRSPIIQPALDQRFALRPGCAEALPGGPPRLEARFASSPADWHNAFARLMLDIDRETKQLGDDRARLDLLGRLRRTLRD